MPSKGTQIIKLLLRKQAEGKLDWQTTETPDEFQVAFPDFAIRIENDRGDTLIRIFDSEGNFLERFNEDDVAVEMSAAFEDLHTEARRAALKVDERLDDVISELENL